jgi:hypothetical protein
MIEVKVAGLRLTGYNGNDSAVAKGTFMYRPAGTDGFFSATAGTHDPLGTPGNAKAGDAPRMLPADHTTHSVFGVFPVNKLILATEGADQDLETIASGTMLIYYTGGEYETDEYDITCSGVGSYPGAKIKLNASGQISLEDAGTASYLPAIGEIVNVSDFPSTSKWFTGGTVGAWKKTVWYRLYPWHAAAGTSVVTPVV